MPPPLSPEATNVVIPPATDERRIWLRVGTLLDGTSTRPVKDAHVVYDRDAIRYVGGPDAPPAAALLKAGQVEPDCDFPEWTLLPGLIEAHAHFFLEGGELDANRRAAFQKQSPNALLELAKKRLERLVRLGIAGVRDAGDKDGVGLALSRLYLSSARPLMPYVDSPGAAIHRKGRYGSFMGEPLEDYATLRQCVEARVRVGADRIKLIPTGIINFREGRVTSEPQMTATEVGELVRAAKEFGKQTFAHASGDEGIERALEGGVDSIEHGFFVRRDQLARMRDRQIAWVPTFAPVQAQVDHAAEMGWDEKVVSHLRRILWQHAASLVKAAEMGVLIIAGSDAGSCGVFHGHGLLDELELMERAGLAPLKVINSATGTPSDRLVFKGKFGQIKPGWRSRFIVTRHSPLETISSLRKCRLVVCDGAVYEAEAKADTVGL